ncbi:MAG: GNAT family N-acetyltransferase [Phycisphaeraceae bacterium]|nr:GNAT family N-acetyltransferase [Phycisphaeraceae bacterium]
MAHESQNPHPTFRGPERLEGTYRVDGAARLAGVPPRERAGDRRTLDAFSRLGIPLDLMWGTYDTPGPGRVRMRHACLIVPGSGRTAMVFLSTPEESGILGDHDGQVRELGACVQIACDTVAGEQSKRIHLIQALPFPDDDWAIEACRMSGFTLLGELLYLGADVDDRADLHVIEPSPGIEFRSISDAPGSWETEREILIELLDRTYEQTLDCPELCGMRETSDVLESHRLAGEFDPSLWYIAMEGGRAVACGLYSLAKGRESMELIYLGVAHEARNRGLGRALMQLGFRAARKRKIKEMTCAVDARNEPALALYARFGMRETGRRVALVRSTRSQHAPASTGS